MSDVKCPSCGYEQEINHDDGFGYSEDKEHIQSCTDCNKPFKFTTSYSIDYEVFCGGEHEMEQSPMPKHTDFYSCTKCDFTEIRAEVKP